MAILNTVAQLGRYRLRARLSQNALCDVWLADIDGAPPGTPAVVVKKLREHATQTPSVREDFLHRAELAKTLQHENIGRVVDALELHGGVACVLEYHDGKTLRQLMSAVGEAGNALPIWFGIHVARCICLALEYSHGFTDPQGRPAPVYHLGLNAENVFLTYQGQLKVTDFGLGRNALAAHSGLTPKASGRIPVGTTASARLPEDPSERADLEAVGSILYELLTGTVPPTSTDSALDFLPPSHHAPWVNAEVDQILRKALSSSYPNRFTAAAEFRSSLEEYLTNRRHDVSASHIAGLVTVLFSNECHDAAPATIRFDDGAVQLARLRSRRTTPPDPSTHSSFEHVDPNRPGFEAPSSAQMTRPTLPSPAMPQEATATIAVATSGAASAPSSRATTSRVTTIEDRQQPFRHDWDLALKHAREQSQLAPRSSGTYPTTKDVPLPPPRPVDPLEQAVIEFEKGLEFRQKGDLNLAMAAWEKALELDPQHRVCKANLNLLKKKLGIP